MLDNAYTPPMYRDAMSSCMGMAPYIDCDMLDCGCIGQYGMFGAMGYPVGGYYGNTNYLGNIKLKPQPNKDNVEILNKKKSENHSQIKETLKYFGIFAGALMVLGLFRGKYVQNFFKGLFKKGGPTPAPAPAPSGKKWWNPFSWFKRSKSTP